MKQVEHNEIDTLLRDLARRTRAERRKPEEFAAEGAHLDADELSSYVERALPPTARTRCTAHLVDCDDCRKIVAQLSINASPLTEERKVELSPITQLGWIQKLAALLSPRMIRYAMPALALVIVSYAFLLWRQQHTSDRPVALNTSSASRVATEPVGNPSATNDQRKIAKGFTDQTATSGEPKAAKPQPTSAATADKAAKPESKTDAAPGASAGPAVAKEKAPPAAEGAAAKQPAYAPEPASPPPPKTRASVAVAEDQKDLAKESEARKRERDNEISEGEDRRDAPRETRRERAGHDEKGVDRAKVTGGATQSASVKRKSGATERAQPSSGASAGQVNSVDDERQTRTIFGRHFRRVGNAWVDDTYKSSMATTKVERGSEQYRALVADEPAIAGFATQLSGEVIVVWKGRVYRID